ncbi:phage head-tail joining protein [Paracoccus litorisediminis]|uniref:GpW protein n=1 Tax=Paracoccus litorisediminis TaxID=2006130 RepID=A0A844HXB2_9RHOB|nr:hypothetical protein [Paracoccus litorisediminis]MTH62102.1 hypothetical protein [Paracoccus litorisediminis]
MAWTQAELDALKSAYATGTTRVSYEGRTVEYDSGAALLERIRVIEAEIAAGGGGRKRPSAGFASFGRS